MTRPKKKRKHTNSIRPRLIKAGVPEVLVDLYGLGDEDFEEICCNIFYHDKEVDNPDLHGRPRQKQFGADITADRVDGTGIDAASCKCYKAILKGQIASFADEFLDHWATHWKDERVQRFILCVPCDLRSAERRREIAVERVRFAALGVKFVAWGRRQLSHRAREHADIMDTFFPSWRSASAFAGPSRLAEQPTATVALLSSADVTQIGLLQSALSGQLIADLDAAQLAMKRGQRVTAERTLQGIREDPVRWSALNPGAQARVLRMQGLLALQSDDTAQCAELLNQADALSPNDEPRARALLTLRTLGRDKALAVLQTPTTPDGALLRAGLLIEAERRLEAQDLLRAWESLKGQNAEWHRLAAHLACIDGRASHGLIDVEAAESLAGDWQAVIETGAIVRYAASLSPVAQFRSGALPDPVPPEFARQDDASRKHLIEASKRFATLAGSESQIQSRQRFELWHFACLALLPDRAAEAQAACIALLNQDPAPAAAVFWALTREYALPLKPLIRRFEKQLRTAPPSLDDLQAALACALAAQDPKKASAILTREADRFLDARDAKFIESWRARIALARKRLPPPESLTDPLERAQALIVLASKDGNWAAVDTFLRSDTLPPDLKFLACMLLAGHGQWTIVAFHIESLLKSVATAAAVRLAIHAWFHTGGFDRIPKALDEYAHYFPGATPPHELKRLRAYAAVRRGDLPAALPLATELAAASGETADQTYLIDLLLHVGDTERAIPLLRDVLPHRGWKPQQLLRWVPAVASMAPELARLLVHKAIELDPDPAYAGFLVEWSYRLGLDHDAHALLSRFGVQTAAPAESAVRMVSLSEVIAYMREQARIGQEMSQAYLRGDAPIHAIAGAARAHLAQLWRSAFRGAAGSALMIRSGNRAKDFFDSPVTAPVHLYVDTTALLTIHELGLLDILDAAGLSLTFAHTLLPVLQALALEIRPQQPSRIALLEALTQAVARKDVQIFGTDALVTPTTVFVVFELGVATTTPQASSETPVRPEITLGAVALELVRRGGTTAEQVSKIRATYSGWQAVAQTIDPSKIDTLVFDSNPLDVAIDAGLLDALKAHFALKVTSDHHVKCLEEINDARARDHLAEQLLALHRRVSEAARTGKYRLLAEPAVRAADAGGKLAKNELLLEPLFELLGVPATQGAWLWIDDRACTGYTYGGGNPIVSTFEVLDYLRSNQHLSEPEYYALLDRLRGANVQILPVSVAEICHWLKQAPVGENRLTETPALRHLRLNFNRLLALEPCLDLDDPPRTAGRMPERPCLLGAFRIARDCLQEIWTSEELSEEHRVAFSDWVWNAVRVERFVRLPPGGDPVAHQKLWQISICQLLVVAFALSTRQKLPEELSRREGYMRWLEQEILDLTDEGEPVALDTIAASLGDYLVDFLARQQSESSDLQGVPPDMLRAFIGHFVSDMPEAIRTRLYAHSAMNAVLKPHVETLVNLGPISFEAGSFWDALARATPDHAPTIKAANGEEYQVHADSPTEFRLSGPNPVHFKNSDCALASQDVAQRRLFLAGAAWLDPNLLPAGLGGIEGLANVESPAARMQVLQEQRERMPAGRYATLRQSMDSGQEFTVDALLPAKADLYVRYLGILSTPDGTIDWDRSATALLESVGMQEILQRWSGLPVPLPAVLQAQYAAQSTRERQALLPKLGTGDLLSPLLAFKLLELECRTLAGESSGSESAQALLLSSLSNWAPHAEAFIAVLLWSDRVWHRDPAWHALSTPLRLACVWAHAGHTLSLLLVKPTSAQTIADRFGTFHQSDLRRVLPFDPDYNSDIATPRRVSAPALLVPGLSAAVGDDPRGLLKAHLSQILEHVSRIGEQARIPSPALFADRRAGRNALGSFLGQPASSVLVESIELSGVRILSNDGRDQVRAETLAQLEQNSSLPEPWGLLHYMGYEWLPTSDADRVNEVVKSLQLAATVDDNWRLIGHVLIAILPYCDVTIRSLWQTQLIEWARRLALVHDIPIINIHAYTESATAAGLLIELAASLARNPTLSASLQALGSLGTAFADAWPAFAPTTRALLARALREVPSADGEALWPAFVKLRAAR
jgi:hypothetical protein